jgi:hypothetical protein
VGEKELAVWQRMMTQQTCMYLKGASTLGISKWSMGITVDIAVLHSAAESNQTFVATPPLLYLEQPEERVRVAEECWRHPCARCCVGL